METIMARVAIVTGGTRGIGEAISIALKNAGYKVAANYMGNDERARSFGEKTGIAVYKWNVASLEDCAAGVAKVVAELGPVDIVVNNAGITRDGTMRKMARQGWDEVLDTNLGGCFNMCKATWEGMLERGFGRVVNIGSINGQAGQYGQVNYAAAKSGIHGFTKALAQEGAPKGITVNAIAPGYIDTDMVAAVPPNVLEKIVARIPVGRLGKAEEIARGVLFLVADEAGFVTGSALSINWGPPMYCGGRGPPPRHPEPRLRPRRAIGLPWARGPRRGWGPAGGGGPQRLGQDLAAAAGRWPVDATTGNRPATDERRPRDRRARRPRKAHRLVRPSGRRQAPAHGPGTVAVLCGVLWRRARRRSGSRQGGSLGRSRPADPVSFRRAEEAAGTGAAPIVRQAAVAVG